MDNIIYGGYVDFSAIVNAIFPNPLFLVLVPFEGKIPNNANAITTFCRVAWRRIRNLYASAANVLFFLARIGIFIVRSLALRKCERCRFFHHFFHAPHTSGSAISSRSSRSIFFSPSTMRFALDGVARRYCNIGLHVRLSQECRYTCREHRRFFSIDSLARAISCL